MSCVNSKGKLQEKLVGIKKSATYVNYSRGPDHEKEHISICRVGDIETKSPWIKGKIVKVEQESARLMIECLEEKGYFTPKHEIFQEEGAKTLLLIDAENRSNVLKQKFPPRVTCKAFCTSKFPTASFDTDFYVAPDSVKGADGADVWLIMWFSVNMEMLKKSFETIIVVSNDHIFDQMKAISEYYGVTIIIDPLW